MRSATWTAICERCGEVQVVPADAALIIDPGGARVAVACPGCGRRLEHAVGPPTAELFQAAGATLEVAAPAAPPVLVPTAKLDPDAAPEVVDS